MSKILSTASTTSTLAATISDVASALLSNFRFSANAQAGGLAARLRYDLGELDINPDCVRGADIHISPMGLDREMMRRCF